MKIDLLALKWICSESCPISAYKIEQDIAVKRASIVRYRSGESNLEKMPINNATKLSNYALQKMGEYKMIVNIDFKSENKSYNTTIEFEHLNDDNTEYVNDREVATARVDIFGGNDIDKDLSSNYESYYVEDDIQDADHIKAWFLSQIEHEYQEPKITEINIEEE
jgi:hypothetical protein